MVRGGRGTAEMPIVLDESDDDGNLPAVPPGAALQTLAGCHGLHIELKRKQDRMQLPGQPAPLPSSVKKCIHEGEEDTALVPPSGTAIAAHGRSSPSPAASECWSIVPFVAGTAAEEPPLSSDTTVTEAGPSSDGPGPASDVEYRSKGLSRLGPRGVSNGTRGLTPDGIAYRHLRHFVKSVYLPLLMSWAKVENQRVGASGAGARKRKESSGTIRRPDLKALTELRRTGRVFFPCRRVGELPGLEVGYICNSRAEMSAIGLHVEHMKGIDCIPAGAKCGDDYEPHNEEAARSGYILPLATSIVMSGVYEDDVDESESITYTGQGGNNLSGDMRQKGEQKLSGANLGLKNSMEQGLPVRVFRGHQPNSKAMSGKVFTYSGLYLVVSCVPSDGKAGFRVFKFTLNRLEGQAPLRKDQVVQFLGKKNPAQVTLEGLVCTDVCNNLERLPVPACNTVDKIPTPPPAFTYLLKNRVPPGIEWPKPAAGCDCKGSCMDSKKCACAKLNGGVIPYNHEHRLVKAQDVVYECGPHCSCGAGCFNRSSQRGLQYRLQLVKTPRKGWGVITLDYIPIGAPVSEYTGDLRRSEDLDDDNGYLFEIDCLQTILGLGGRQKRVISNYEHPSGGLDCDARNDPEFTIDAGSSGSFARFVNHSCDPNLYVQCVLSEHHDLRLARVMLFAAENILAGTELSYDYGYPLVESRDDEDDAGRIDCHCGATGCRKRLR